MGEKKKGLLLITAFILIMSVFLSACGGGQGNTTSKGANTNNNSTQKTKKSEGNASHLNLASSQVLNLAAEGDISTMNVHHATDGVSLRALEEVRSGLIRLNVKGKPIPDMAAAMPKVSQNKTVYTFKLRKDAKWSNGDPVTAQDFVYSWRKEVSKDTAGEYAYIYKSAGIKNAAKIMDPHSNLYNKVKKLGIKALDKHTLQVTLERPIPFFVTLLSAPYFFPVDPKVVNKYGAQYAQDPDKMVYNGPFVMAKWNHGTGWEFKKNPKYWDKAHIHLTKVQYKINPKETTQINLYKTGQLDFMNISSVHISQFKGKPDLHEGVLGPSIVYLSLNEKNPAFQNEDIRDAIYNAINREKMVKYLLKDGSSPAYYFVGKDFASLPDGKDFRSAYPTINKHSLKWAKKKWNKGLKEIGKSSIQLKLATYNSSVNEKLGQFIQAQLEKNLPGIKVTFNAQPIKGFLQMDKAGKFDIALTSWGPDYPDPMSDLDMWVTGGPFNDAGFSSQQYDQLIQKAKHSGAKPAQRMKLMQKAEKLLLSKAIVVPLYQPAFVYLQKPYVKQFEVNRPGPNDDWTYAYIQKH